MVSSLQSIRTMSAQYLLKALKDTQSNSQSQSQNQGNSKRSALLSRYGVTSTNAAKSSLLGHLATLPSPAATTKSAPVAVAAASHAASNDILSSDFMTTLKQTLTDRVVVPGAKGQASDMLAALKAGTLTVSDPLRGTAVKAWDVDSAAEKSTTHKAGSSIQGTDWVTFLKNSLTRTDGKYAQKPDGSYVDKSTGQNAFFGTIGSEYVYLTWPAAKAG